MGRRRVDKQHALVHLIVTDVVLLWIHAGDYKTCKSERGWDLSEHRTDFSSSSLDRLSSRCLARRSGSIAALRKTDCCGLAFFGALSTEHQLSAVISQSAFWSSFVNYRTRLRVTCSSENIHVLSAGVNEGQVSDFTSFNGLIFCQPAEPVTSSSILWGGWILFLAYMIQVTSSRTKS